MGISTSIYGTWLDAYINIVGSDEWVKIGHFKAEKPTVQNGVVTFTAYDIMNEFSKIMFNKKLGTVTLKECYRAIISSINSTVSGISYISISDDIASLEINADMIFGYDCRSALAYIAGYVGRNCVISNTGAIEMRGFTSCSYTLNSDRIDVPELSDSTAVLNFLAVSVNSATKLLSGNDGEGLEFICPIMTQDRLDTLFNSLSSTTSPIHSFKAGKIKQLLGDFRLQLGDVISLKYGSETYTIPISSIAFEFDGGLSCDIESLPLAEASALSIADSLDFTSKQNYNKTIKEITNYYLATSLDKDVTISTTGWTESTQTVTAENRYLWNYECIELVDGTKYKTEPCIIGNFAIDGVGVESITEYYVTTETTTQPQKSEFLTMIQTPTESKPYLWNYEVIAYTNDSKTPYESDIRLIGVYSKDGKAGTTYYTWIKYADDAQGGGISNEPTGKSYVGIATNQTSSTESDDPTDYKWSLMKGDKGTDGISVLKVETQYYLSTSETSLTGGSWSTTAPTWQDGYYLWTRLITTYSDNTSSDSDPVVDASWKKTTAVEEASKELNENLANALGLYVTEETKSGSIVRYYHSKYPLSSCVEGDTILVFNASGIGVCKTGWNGGSPVFTYGTTFDGKAVWDILVANKIKADYIEAGTISSVESAKVQSKWNLDTGEMTFESDGATVKIQGKVTDESSGVTEQDAGITLANSVGGWVLGENAFEYMTFEYIQSLIKWAIDKLTKPNTAKPADPYFSKIEPNDIKTTNLHCKDIYIAKYNSAGEFVSEKSWMTDLDAAFTSLGETITSLSDSVKSLQQKVTELEATLGQTHEHTAATAISENYAAPSCTEAGSYDSVVYCATCGEEMSRETISVDPTGHSDTNGDGYCDTCGAVTEYILTVGNSLTVDVAQCTNQGGSTDADISQFTLIRFVAPKKGKYTFTSAQGKLTAGTSYDTYGRLYNSTKSTIIASDDDSGGNSQFKITQELEAGTYYLAVKFFQTASAGTVVISAEYAEETPTYTITTAVSPTGGGTVTGGGTYESGASATLTATANSGYTFKQWSDGVTTASRTITVNGDATYTAIFEVTTSSEQIIIEEVTTPVVISAANTSTYLKFVPKYSGKYTFVSLDQTDLDPDGAIYDSNKTSLASDYAKGAVSVSYDSFVAGATYYLSIRLYDGTGTVNVKVSYDNSSSSQQGVAMYATTNDSSMGTATLTPNRSDNMYYVDDTYTLTAQPNSGYIISSMKIYYGDELILTQTNAGLIEVGMLDDMYDNLETTSTISSSMAEEESITYAFYFEPAPSGGSTTYEEDTIVDGVLYIGTNTTEIADNAYIYNTTITNVVIPDGVTQIGMYAFANCASLQSVTIPNTVTSILGYAFKASSNLTTVRIGSGVTFIGMDAFADCTSLTDIYYAGTENQWNAIRNPGTTNLTNVTIHYNS